MAKKRTPLTPWQLFQAIAAVFILLIIGESIWGTAYAQVPSGEFAGLLPSEIGKLADNFEDPDQAQLDSALAKYDALQSEFGRTSTTPPSYGPSSPSTTPVPSYIDSFSDAVSGLFGFGKNEQPPTKPTPSIAPSQTDDSSPAPRKVGLISRAWDWIKGLFSKPQAADAATGNCFSGNLICSQAGKMDERIQKKIETRDKRLDEIETKNEQRKAAHLEEMRSWQPTEGGDGIQKCNANGCTEVKRPGRAIWGNTFQECHTDKNGGNRTCQTIIKPGASGISLQTNNFFTAGVVAQTLGFASKPSFESPLAAWSEGPTKSDYLIRDLARKACELGIYTNGTFGVKSGKVYFYRHPQPACAVTLGSPAGQRIVKGLSDFTAFARPRISAYKDGYHRQFYEPKAEAPPPQEPEGGKEPSAAPNQLNQPS